MRTITFLRLRPAHQVNEITVATRLREGTTTLELQECDPAAVATSTAGGALPVGTDVAAEGVAAWVVSADDALSLVDRGVDGRRITVTHGDDRANTLDGLARSRAAYLRTGRSRVAEAVELCGLPGIDAIASVYVDSVDGATTALAAGAGDLLLRDWGADQIGELREVVVGGLVERVAIPPGVGVDDARLWFSAPLFKAYLDQIDAAGRARPRYEWAPGVAEAPPLNAGRMSSQWPDTRWADGSAPGLSGASPSIRSILDTSLDGERPSVAEIAELLRARGDDVDAIASAADTLRIERVGDTVTFVVNRNINYTNVCYFRCGFCAFSKGPRSLNLRGDPYLMSVEEVVERTVEAKERGATEVCLQGGIHPEFTGQFYVDVLQGIKSATPDMHIHGFTPLEVWQGAETLGMPVREFLTMLRDAGLGTLPGTAAEILDDRIRDHLCPDKIRTSQWAEVMLTAHDLELRSTSTIMFGHIDDADSWANHFEVLRTIQERTGGFTEFVPLPFVHMASPIYLRGRARPGPTWDEVVLIHAVARLALDGLIENIQASWVKLGLEGGARLLAAGCNDLGGTLMNETISRAAGASHGQEVDASDFEDVISGIGRVPVQRNTLYGRVDPASHIAPDRG